MMGDFSSRDLIIKALVLSYFTFCLTIVYYSLMLSADDLGGNLYTNFIFLSLSDIPSCIVIPWAMDRLGRKKTITMSMLVAGACCVAISITPHRCSLDIARTVLAMCGKFFSSISYWGVWTWISELYPTSVRSTAVGFFNMTNNVGAICAPWVSKGL